MAKWYTEASLLNSLRPDQMRKLRPRETFRGWSRGRVSDNECCGLLRHYSADQMHKEKIELKEINRNAERQKGRSQERWREENALLVSGAPGALRFRVVETSDFIVSLPPGSTEARTAPWSPGPVRGPALYLQV